MNPTNDRRFKLAAIAGFSGQIVPARLLQRTSDYVPNIDRFHPLIRGIYKPAGEKYPLSIIINIGSPYAGSDELVFLNDHRWFAEYAPVSGGPNMPDNIAMDAAMHDQVPIAVFRQRSRKTTPEGSTYQVLGLALLTGFDSARQVYTVEAAPQEAIFNTASIYTDPVQQQKVVLYASLANEFAPTQHENPATYLITKEKRNAAFKQIVLKEYDYKCAVCELQCSFEGGPHEATAAHIWPKEHQGTDDPRNGLSLCRTHHWAFDESLFTISPDYRVLVSRRVDQARTNNFNLRELEQKPIILPSNNALRPHETVLEWHRERFNSK